MSEFIAREEELNTLNKFYNKSGFQMSVIYGRRRIGKSTLIKEFIKGKKSVFFTATKTGAYKNIEMFGKLALASLAPDMSALSFTDFESLFSFLGEQCKKERIVIVVDELPYLAESDKSVLSVLQSYIDNQWQYGQMFLILCGSSVSFMEDEVLSEKSPVFGRRTSQLKIEAFDYLDSAKFVPKYSFEDKAIVYGITGGVAKYLSLFDDSKSLDENIIEQYFSKSGYLYEEAENLLVQEFRSVSTYSDIIDSISHGSNRLTEISDKAHIDKTVVSHALSNLVATGIVMQVHAITEESNKKKIQYVLKDKMFRFWYSFVPNGISAIELGKGDVYYKKNVKPKISEYMGLVFEDMCRHHTLRLGVNGDLNCFVTKVGKWWGVNPEKQEQTDIDVVGLDTDSNMAVLGECKFKKELFDKKSYDELIERKDLISRKYEIVQYLLFSKSGFSKCFDENTDKRRVKLVCLEDMYKATSKKKIDWTKFSGRGEKCFPCDAQEYVSLLREGDR